MPEDHTIYNVLVNVENEYEYSMWPVGRVIPPGFGFIPIGFSGTKQRCEKFIEEASSHKNHEGLRKERERMIEIARKNSDGN